MMLYIVSTPIGNLEDITLRAIKTLKSVEIIACEDTRHTRVLLERYEIPFCHFESIRKSQDKLRGVESRNPLKNDQISNTNDQSNSNEKNFIGTRTHLAKCEGKECPCANDFGQARMTKCPKLISYHQHSSEKKVKQIIEFLKVGKDIALVTDAGTPGISDPGQKLISEAISQNIEITSIPGSSAFVSALSISGFDISEFIFIGFLPNKKGRQTKLREISDEKRTVVLYESVYRIKKLLKELDEVTPERQVCVTRELTKKFEEVYRGKAAEVIDRIKEKGEFAVVIEGKND